jgi:uncharacterized membrane protein YdjX (TVP38/TMEM64 family)
VDSLTPRECSESLSSSADVEMKKPAVLILAVVIALLVIAWSGNWLHAFTDPEAIQAMLARAGFWGPLLFIVLALGMFAAFMLAPIVWASTAVWPLPLAFVYSFVAALLASLLTYAIARRLGRGWAQKRVPASIQRWEERLRVYPFSTIIALRILLWANPLIDLFAAVARVPTRTYLLASVVGLLPPTAFHILLGAGGITIAGHLPWWGWVLAAAVALASGFAFGRLRARRA